MTHICVSKLTIIDSDNGLSPDRRQAIIWTNAGILLIRPLGTNFNEILIEIPTFSFTKMRLKVSSAKRRPFCLGLNVLNEWYVITLCYWWGAKSFVVMQIKLCQSLSQQSKFKAFLNRVGLDTKQRSSKLPFWFLKQVGPVTRFCKSKVSRISFRGLSATKSQLSGRIEYWRHHRRSYLWCQEVYIP